METLAVKRSLIPFLAGKPCRRAGEGRARETSRRILDLPPGRKMDPCRILIHRAGVPKAGRDPRRQADGFPHHAVHAIEYTFMPSPLPGMDPFIEGHDWEDFHGRFVPALSDALVPLVRPNYVVRVERRVYVEHEPEEPSLQIKPDLAVAGGPLKPSKVGSAAKTGSTPESPLICTLLLPVEQRETFLTLRDRQSLEVVTVVEVLSPGNKRPGSDGRREYLEKRELVLRSPAHLVELDLLRGGQALPVVETLPPAAYRAFVCRSNMRPRAEVYSWGLRDRLVDIPVPLRVGEKDVVIPLSEVFIAVYDRAGYDYSLDYGRPLAPPLTPDDQAWATTVLER